MTLRKAGWKCEKVVTLFLYGNRYYIVKNISRLWTRQFTTHHAPRIFCERCLRSFNGEGGYDKHLKEFRLWEREIAEEEERRKQNQRFIDNIFTV
jgi:hypothetical protein